MSVSDKVGASIAGFFDEFNKEADNQAIMAKVNRQLCEVLTELAENMVNFIGSQPEAMMDATIEASEVLAVPTPAQAPDDDDDDIFDEVAAFAAYNDALSAVMREQGVTSKDMSALPTDHPLKELYFAAFDERMFHTLLSRFIEQVRNRKEGQGDWVAEAAEGECDEDHTLE